MPGGICKNNVFAFNACIPDDKTPLQFQAQIETVASAFISSVETFGLRAKHALMASLKLGHVLYEMPFCFAYLLRDANISLALLYLPTIFSSFKQ